MKLIDNKQLQSIHIYADGVEILTTVQISYPQHSVYTALDFPSHCPLPAKNRRPPALIEESRSEMCAWKSGVPPLCWIRLPLPDSSYGDSFINSRSHLKLRRFLFAYWKYGKIKSLETWKSVSRNRPAFYGLPILMVFLQLSLVLWMNHVLVDEPASPVNYDTDTYPDGQSILWKASGREI